MELTKVNKMLEEIGSKFKAVNETTLALLVNDVPLCKAFSTHDEMIEYIGHIKAGRIRNRRIFDHKEDVKVCCGRYAGKEGKVVEIITTSEPDDTCDIIYTIAYNDNSWDRGMFKQGELISLSEITAEKALKYGHFVKDFQENERRIRIIKWYGSMYWHMMKDGEIVEFVKL